MLIMLKFVLLYFFFYLKKVESADSLIQIQFKIDKTFLASNLNTSNNEVTFKNLTIGSNMTDRVIDLSGCLRMKLDFVSQQVFTFTFLTLV
jgi:hypothetical protein